MMNTDSFKKLLQRIEVKKNELNNALEKYTEASVENIDTLKKDSDKAFEELRKEYRLLIDELIKSDKM